jgi:tetratricopeptide (TPR) repeat protein
MTPSTELDYLFEAETSFDPDEQSNGRGASRRKWTKWRSNAMQRVNSFARRKETALLQEKPGNPSLNIRSQIIIDAAQDLRLSASKGGGIADARKAINLLRQALLTTPDDPKILNQLGLSLTVLAELSPSPDAIDAMGKAIVAFDDALKPQTSSEAFHYRVMINKAVSLSFIASAAKDDKKLNESEQILFSIVEKINNKTMSDELSIIIKRLDIHRIYFNIGCNFFTKNDYNNAKIYFEYALNEYTNESNRIGRARSLCSIGECHTQLGEHVDAIQEYDRAISYVSPKEDTLVWCRIQTHRAQSILYYLPKLCKMYKATPEEVSHEPMLSLEKIREITSNNFAPSLWALATTLLGTFNKILQNFNLSLSLYTEALPFLSLEDRFRIRHPFIESFMEVFGIKSREDLALTIEAVLAGAGIARSDWAAALIEITKTLVANEPETASKPPLPEKARILYADRTSDPKLAGLNIIDFLRAEYGPWLDGTLTRPYLRHLDPPAEMALRNWLRNNTIPSDIRIPTKSETIDALIGSSYLPEAFTPKVGRALERRHQRAPKTP